mmetsp:Transcript_78942/g.118657  ORF Transcript_78942/g.118657 Transcript_78942/m.118657 type:complete len:423 (-) Transcript_78942:73-1341(-)
MHCRASVHSSLVEPEVRTMEPFCRTFRLVSDPQIQHHAWDALGEVGEVFAAHSRLSLFNHVGTHQLNREVLDHASIGRVVDGRRVGAHASEGRVFFLQARLVESCKDHLYRAPVRHRDPRHDLSGAAFDLRIRVLPERPQRTAEGDGGRHDVEGLARMHARDRHHRLVNRRNVACYDALERGDDGGGSQDRVHDANANPTCRVTSFAMHNHLEAASGGEDRASESGEGAGGEPGPDMHAEDFLDRRRQEHALLRHHEGAGATLLGRLEDEADGALELALVTLEDLSSAEQHRHVRVVAARVHATLRLGLERRSVVEVRLEDRKSVHVRTKRHNWLRSRSNCPDDATFRNGVLVWHSDLVEHSAHDLRGLVKAILEFRIAVKFPPYGHNPVQDTCCFLAKLLARDAKLGQLIKLARFPVDHWQ